MDLHAILPALLVWAALEVALRVRDLIRGKGGAAGDRGTRILIGLVLGAAIWGGLIAAGTLQHDPVWQIGGWSLIAGEVIMWTGLALRLWAVLVLGRSFRTTVEVDSGQTVVDRGPYRYVRHPSYTGLLMILIGFGLALGNWLSLALAVLLPPIALLRRISVEEITLARILGRPYQEYQTRTKRLIPGLW